MKEINQGVEDSDEILYDQEGLICFFSNIFLLPLLMRILAPSAETIVNKLDFIR